MTDRLEVYRCEVCGNIVEVIRTGSGDLTCCGQAMKLLKENTTDAAVEKHVPVVEKVDGGYKVTVGSVAHPMADEHFIEWIELIDDNKVQIAFLVPGQAPEATFVTSGQNVVAREHCNLHGLWKK